MKVIRRKRCEARFFQKYVLSKSNPASKSWDELLKDFPKTKEGDYITPFGVIKKGGVKWQG